MIAAMYSHLISLLPVDCGRSRILPNPDGMDLIIFPKPTRFKQALKMTFTSPHLELYTDTLFLFHLRTVSLLPYLPL